MTQYLSIEPVQEPYDNGLDESGRAQCAFNVRAMSRPSDSFIQDLITALSAAGVGQEGVTIFGSSKAQVPSQGTVLTIRATGGTGPVGTHNDGAGAYRRPSALLIAHAEKWKDAEALAVAAYSALLAVRNKDVA